MDRFKKIKIIFSLLLCITVFAGCIRLPELPGRKESKAFSSTEEDKQGKSRPDLNGKSDKKEDKQQKAPSLAALQEKISKNACKVGLAFLGYVGSEASYDEVVGFVRSCECASENDFLCNLSESNIVSYEGGELYAIVPADDSGAIVIYPSEISKDAEYSDDRENPLCVVKPGEPVVLRCNISDIYSNVLVCIEYADDTVEFRPYLSLMDGRLGAVDGCYDFSIYPEDGNGEADIDANVQIAYEILTENEEIKNYIDLGMVVQYTGATEEIDGRQCYVFSVGTDHGDYVVTEFFYAVCDNLIYSYDGINDGWSTVGIN